MKTIDHRRHAMRSKPGQHLSQAGVDLARRVGSGEFGPVGSYDRVVTSTVPRAFETAIAMGFAVDEQLDGLARIPTDAFEVLGWPCSLGQAARAMRDPGPLQTYVVAQARLLRSIADQLPDGGRALVISHGGIVEAGAVGLTPDADHARWGPAIGYCGGLRLFVGDTVTVQRLEVPPADYLVLN